MITPRSSISDVKKAYEGATTLGERCRIGQIALALLNSKERPDPLEVDELRGRITHQLALDKEALTDEFIHKMERYGIRGLDRYTILKGELNLGEKLGNLSAAQKEKIFKEICTLSFLETLDLSFNQLNSLPLDIGKLTNLTTLDLSINKITSLPADFSKLTNLTTLGLTSNKLTSLPPDFSKLTNLTTLTLSENQLTSFPPDFGELTNLIILELNNNQLTSFPFDIGKLTNLTRLFLGGNELTSIPPDIGKLTNLTEIYLRKNQLVTLPAAISELSRDTARLTILNLESNPIASQATSGNELGQEELRGMFGDRAVFSRANATAMEANTTFEEVNNKLDENKLSIQRATFKELKAPKIPGEAFTCEEMLAELGQLMAAFNMEDLQNPLYLSFKNMTVDWDIEGKSNKEAIETGVVPKLRGYIKLLYNVPLGPEDQKANMMMYEKDKPETRRILSFIFRELQQEEFGRSDHFEQLTAGILHCQTGQSEAINATAYALLGVPTSDNPEDRIKMWAGHFKNNLFQQALLTKAGENTQNVHLLDYYRGKLAEVLGLSSTIEGYEDRIGRIGFDPFAKNPANAYETYFGVVTPERMIASLVEGMQSQTDREVVEDRFTVEKIKQNLAAKKPEDQQRMVEGLQKLLGREDLSKAHKAQIEKQLQKQMERSSDPTPEQKKTLEEIAKKYRTSEEKYLTRLIRSNARTRPFTTGDMITLMKNLGIARDEKNWWEGLLTAEPEDPKSTITYDGAKQILLKMDILKKKGDAREGLWSRISNWASGFFK